MHLLLHGAGRFGVSFWAPALVATGRGRKQVGRAVDAARVLAQLALDGGRAVEPWTPWCSASPASSGSCPTSPSCPTTRSTNALPKVRCRQSYMPHASARCSTSPASSGSCPTSPSGPTTCPSGPSPSGATPGTPRNSCPPSSSPVARAHQSPPTAPSLRPSLDGDAKPSVRADKT